MAGQCVLGVLSHIGQQFVDAPFGNSYKPASLILITEGESGAGKTEAMKLTHLKIDEYEIQQGKKEGKIREKITDINKMLEVAKATVHDLF